MNSETGVIFVDDEQMILKTLKRLFVDSGFDILTAESGEEGLEIIENNPHVHVVVSDYKMPGMNGVEFLKRIKERWPETMRIILSGYADTANVIAAINDAKIFKFIAKPWDNNDFKGIITEAAIKYHINEQGMETLSAWKLVESLPLILLKLDDAGAITWMNFKAAEVFGEDILQKNISDVLPETKPVVSNSRDHGEASDKVHVLGKHFNAYAAVIIKDSKIEGSILVLDDKE